MNEKNKPAPILVLKPVPMKLFATWEVDRTPPNCIPRLCSLTLTRLVLLKSLGPDVSSIVIAVKMQGSKRTLRSNEIILSATSLLDTELELSFSLQYPHFLKRDGNKLHVMLQRRKRYKNRTILGYKTLAEGIVNMSQVLQRQIEMELDLLSDYKEPKGHIVIIVGRVSVSALTSQPVDHEDNSKSSDRVTADYSDDDEDFSSGNEEVEVEGSDSEPMADERGRGRKNKINGNVRQRNLKQKFISLLKRFRVNEAMDNDQETISRKLSGGDMDGVDIDDLFGELEDLSDSEPEMDTMSISSTPKPSLRPFFSSSGSLLHDGLNVPGWLLHKKNCHAMSMSSIQSILRTDRTLERISDESSKKADSDSHADNWTDSDPPPPNTSPPRHSDDKKETAEKDRRTKLFTRDRNNSSMSKFRKSQILQQQQHQLSQQQNPTQQETTVADILSPGQSQASFDTNQSDNRKCMDQLNKLFPSDDGVPDTVCLVSMMDWLGTNLANKLQDKYKVITVASSSDSRNIITYLVNKMQKFCNLSPKPSAQIKLLLAGSDSFINNILKHYIDQHSYKSPDWTTYIKFFIVPLGSNYLCRYLGSIDNTYNSLFSNDSWRECLEKVDNDEALIRIRHYLQQSSSSVNLPIAEAMLTLKGNNSGEESSQVFIPFVIDVRLGSVDIANANSIDSAVNDESQLLSPVTVPSSNMLINSSPPSNVTDKKIDRSNTPPNSPNVNSHNSISSQYKESIEPLELQLDYWLVSSKGNDIKNDVVVSGKKNESGKFTLKTAFKSVHIARLSLGDAPTSCFSINYTTKEKKQKIMRLGKKKEKEKESDQKPQVLDGVFRLICSPRTQNVPLVVNIDGNEWTGVKFFQVSAQWQTHVRFFCVTLFNNLSENVAYSS